MRFFTRHLTRCSIAGIVALLPVGGLVLTIAFLESSIARAWPDDVFYFPGLGLVAAFAIVYLIGLVVSTFLGRWLWKRIDALIENLPALGQLYQTLKQILGYGEGKEAIFQRVVLVRARETGSEEIGLLTSEFTDERGARKLTVFVPGAPNPATGRLLVADDEAVRPLDISVSDALKSLVSVGKAPLHPST